MHLIDNLVSPVHREVNVDVRFQTESSEMMERDGEPLQRIVEMWKRAVSFLSLFETPNLPEIPLELLLREPRHSVLPLQRVHLQVKVEILFRLNILFNTIRSIFLRLIFPRETNFNGKGRRISSRWQFPINYFTSSIISLHENLKREIIIIITQDFFSISKLQPMIRQ